jgi:hypothetical protein
MIMAWLAARVVPIGAGLAVLVAIVAWDYTRIWKAESRGEDRALVKVERNNEKVQELGRRGAGNGGLPVPGSVRDPGYRIED